MSETLNTVDRCTDVESISFQKEQAASRFSRYPFDPSSLPFEATAMNYMEINSNSQAYQLVMAHLAKHSLSIDGYAQKANSFVAPTKFANEDGSDDEEDCGCKSKPKNELAICVGLGLFAFKDNDGHEMFALHQSIGDPVGTQCGISMMMNIVLFTSISNDISIMANFLQHLITASQSTDPFSFNCYKWNSKYEYWRKSASVRARNIDSVILPEATKEKLLTDVIRFLSPKTRNFYEEHGIPYRRSYLFHGVPGAGKTSLIKALAGHFKRNISFLQLTDPDMTDLSLLSSIQDLRRNTIVVIEDIDACFSKDRSNKIQHSKVSFSGLLNALDGVGSTSGQMFILTTNIKDQLDPALIRCGRVDVQIEFKYAEDEQMAMMWKSFYPEAISMAEEFTRLMRVHLNGKNINTSSLQHYFVLNMHSSAEEALSSIENILADIEFTEEFISKATPPSNDEATPTTTTTTTTTNNTNNTNSSEGESSEHFAS